ncbi:hypothetical protein, partial [Pseudomonas abyssi]|uniref:hypothetical protein n=1 Tax=Pseudomonas abyssi TaxID=170540 RepID=UPI001C2BF026
PLDEGDVPGLLYTEALPWLAYRELFAASGANFMWRPTTRQPQADIFSGFFAFLKMPAIAHMPSSRASCGAHGAS